MSKEVNTNSHLKFHRCFAILAISSLMFGCGVRSWDSKPGSYITGTNAMASVSTFIATYGWNSSTNVEDLWRWEDLQLHSIRDIPWTRYEHQQFSALTHDGILYVLSNPGHDDHAGVAYNPQTNHFPPYLDGFKPIGGHWYVWCIGPYGPNLLKQYE